MYHYVPNFIAEARPLTAALLTFLRNRFSFMNLWSPGTQPGNFFQLGERVFFTTGVVGKCDRPGLDWTLVDVLYTDGNAPLKSLDLDDGIVALAEHLPDSTTFVVCKWCKRTPDGHENLYTLHGRALMSYPITPPADEEAFADMVADFVGMAE